MGFYMASLQGTAVFGSNLTGTTPYFKLLDLCSRSIMSDFERRII